MRLRKIRDWPIRWKVLAVLLFTSIAPLPIIGYLNHASLHKQLEEETSIGMEFRVDSVKSTLENRERQSSSLAKVLAERLDLVTLAVAARQGPDADEGLAALLDRWEPERRERYEAAFLSPSGQMIAGTQNVKRFQGKQFTYKYVTTALKGTGAVSEMHFIDREADLQPEAIAEGKQGFDMFKSPMPAIAYAHPVKKNDQIHGIIVVWVKAEWLWTAFNATERDIWGVRLNSVWPNNAIALYDDRDVQIGNSLDPRTLFHPSRPLNELDVRDMIKEQRFGKWTASFLNDVRPIPRPLQSALSNQIQAPVEVYEPQQPQYMGLVRSVGPRDGTNDSQSMRWTFYLLVPQESMSIPVMELARRMFFISCAVMLVTVTFGMLLAAHVMKPIRSLAESIKAFGKGDLTARAAVTGDDEIGHLADVFNAMADRLKLTVENLNETEEDLRHAHDEAVAANMTKGRFLASMSHELRTPLNIILGYSELLQEIAQDEGYQRLLPDLEKIQGAGKHLLTLISDILDLSRIEAGRIELFLESFDLAAMVQSCATAIRPVVEKNGNTLRVECEGDLGSVYTDQTRVRQCLFNLLSNAGKFTENGQVILQVRRENQKGRDMLSFRVEDTGIGMSPEQRGRLFQPFVQLRSPAARGATGAGLGLAISLKLSELLGGTIRAESTPGKGSVFTFDVPAELAKPAAEVPTKNPVMTSFSAPESAPDRPKVLVVDDDPAVLDMLGRFLSREGYEIVGVSRGDNAVAMAKKVRPQTITLDVFMPECDGWSVLSALKADPETAAIPVIMLSIVEDRNLGRALGAVDCLTKPLDRDRLLLALRKHCRRPSPGVALVVEDEADSRAMFEEMLQRGGWSVTLAGNGRQALACTAARRPSLILLDLMLPEMDGFEFLNELRQNPDWQSIPVIVVTAKDLSAEDRQFLNGPQMLSGCVRQILQKGHFNREELLRRMAEVAGSRP